MSRIRRLCRLLVDCDDNTASMESIEEDPDDYFVQERDGKQSQYVPSQSPPGTGTVAMAKVWMNIVFREVSEVNTTRHVTIFFECSPSSYTFLNVQDSTP